MSVIPREGVESELAVDLRESPSAEPVIPREGVESPSAIEMPTLISAVIPREGVESR